MSEPPGLTVDLKVNLHLRYCLLSHTGDALLDLGQVKVNVLEWPNQSSDLNQIEMLREDLK